MNSLVKWVLVTIVGAVIGVIVTSVIGVLPLAMITWKVSHGFAQPDCSDPGPYEQVPVDHAAAYYVWSDHTPKSTFDDDPDTAWVGSGPHHNGHDVIGWDFPRQQDLRLICVRNGYTKNNDTYTTNGRIKRVIVRGCGSDRKETLLDHVTHGGPSSPVMGDGALDFQTIQAHCESKTVRFLILSAYKRGHGEVVALSDVRFYGH